jgi:hypothetical protein
MAKPRHDLALGSIGLGQRAFRQLRFSIIVAMPRDGGYGLGRPSPQRRFWHIK